MAFIIEVVNDQHDGRQIQVYHYGPNQSFVLDATGPGSSRKFSLRTIKEYLEIQFKVTDPKESDHYITLPKKAYYRFDPNGTYNPQIQVLTIGGRTKLFISKEQNPTWILEIRKPFGDSSRKTPNDNVTVRETGG